MTYEPRPSMNPTGRSRTYRNHVITAPKNDPKRLFPCWCGASLVRRYRTYEDCCWQYLRDNQLALYLDLVVESSEPVYFHTVKRADGNEICGEYSFMVAMDDKDWIAAEEDAFDLDEQREYWLETWVLVRRQRRMLGPEPLDDEDDDDDEADEPGRDPEPVSVPPGAPPG